MELLTNRKFLMGIAAGIAIVYGAKNVAALSFVKSPLQQIGVI